MKNRKLLSIGLICIILFANLLSAQDNLQIQKRLKSAYTLPTLPMVPGQTKDKSTVIKKDFTLTLRDNVILDCSKFYPSEPNPYLPNGYPAVIMCHGYGDRKETLEGFASAQASYGYAVYTYSMRGQGNSGGLSNLISMTEAQDLIEFVYYVKHDIESGLDSSNVLIMGGSQGGIIPYMALCNGMKVRTIISALSSPEFASSWIENGSIKMTFLWTISYTPDSAKYSHQVDAMRKWVYSGTKDKWDSLAYWLPKDRNFTDKVSQNTIPILIENAWQDKFFNAQGNLGTIPLLNSPKRYYYGAVRGHGGDYSFTEDEWHMNFFNEWFFYWLFNIDNGILTRPKFHYAFSTFPEINGMWSFVHDSSAVWPPNNMVNTKLYFKSNGKLETTPGTATNSYASLPNSVNKKLNMTKAVDLEFTGTEFTGLFKKSTLTYLSNTLTQDLKLLGTPQIGLDYLTNAAECQFNFQIYELSGTKSKLVTRVNYTDRNATANTRKNVIINGLSHGHIFKTGNKIKIVVTNLDTAPDDTSFMGTNPHVLPSLKNGTARLYFTNKSYISIPLQTTNPNFLSIFLQTDESSQKIIKYNLSQNYPNPFNPITSIDFALPFETKVSITIYDLTGKKIKTLINERKEAGYYQIHFNANGLASGIYFYRLEADKFAMTRKMILIK